MADRLPIAILRGDSARAEAVFDTIRSRPRIFAGYPLNVADWAGDYDFAERAARAQTIEDRPANTQFAGHLNLARILAAGGRWEEADREITRASRMDPQRALTLGATLATLPFLNVSRESLARWRDGLRSWTPQAAETHAVPTRAYDRHARLYLLGLVSSKLGDFEAAAACADSLRLIPDEAATAVPGDLAATIRADIAWRSGQPPERVLQALEAVSGHVPAGLWQNPVFALEHARYLRAVALLAAGGAEDAEVWLKNTFSFSPGVIYYRAGVKYLAARALDALSRPAEAREARAAYERLWARADAPIDLPGSAADPPRR